MSNNDRLLAPRQTRAIAVVITSKNITEGCRSIGVNRKSFYVWFRTNPTLVQEFMDACRQVVACQIQNLKLLTEQVISTLCDLLADECSSVRLRAALGTLARPNSKVKAWLKENK